MQRVDKSRMLIDAKSDGSSGNVLMDPVGGGVVGAGGLGRPLEANALTELGPMGGLRLWRCASYSVGLGKWRSRRKREFRFRQTMKMFPGSYLLIVVAKIFVIAVVAISLFVSSFATEKEANTRSCPVLTLRLNAFALELNSVGSEVLSVPKSILLGNV